MNQPLTRDQRARLLKLSTYASVATALVLIAAKLGAWLLTGSVSLLASLVDSLMDAAASVVNLFAVRYSLQPPDAEHRFGHGKAESLAGLVQAAFIGGSAVFLMLHAIERLLQPQPLKATAVGIVVMVFSVLATIGLLALQRHVVRRTGSLAIKADMLHYATDFLANTAVIVALLLSHLGWLWLDPAMALAIAGYIAHSAWKIGHEAVQMLLDRALPADQHQRILGVALAHPEVLAIHELRSRQSGAVAFIQIHLELNDEISLKRAHAIGVEVEQAITRDFPNAEIIIHHDPQSVAKREVEELGQEERITEAEI